MRRLGERRRRVGVAFLAAAFLAGAFLAAAFLVACFLTAAMNDRLVAGVTPWLRHLETPFIRANGKSRTVRLGDFAKSRISE